jgi:protein-tyrosine-phosphatase
MLRPDDLPARRRVRSRLLLIARVRPSDAAAGRPHLREPATRMPQDGSEMPTILFVCVHNAGRSQMAAGFARALGGDDVRVLSGGSEPAAEINPVAVAAMAEEGIDIADAVPSILDVDDVRAADAVVTMGCGDACPVFPGKRYEDWELRDPAGIPLEEVRPIRDEIRDRVARLLGELTRSAG